MILWIATTNLLEHRFGFRKGKSSIDAVGSLVNVIVEGLENWEHTVHEFTESPKVFDCVDHEALLNSRVDWGIQLLADILS